MSAPARSDMGLHVKGIIKNPLQSEVSKSDQQIKLFIRNFPRKVLTSQTK